MSSPPSLGPTWLDPSWLFERFGQQMFLLSAAFVFIECGLLFPFLPGDSLLFTVGLFIRRADSGQPGLQVSLVVACVVLSLVAFAGNVAGYEIGRLLGPALYRRQGRFLRSQHLDQTRIFFDRYGSKALVLGRFVPVVRTFVTVVAGVSGMSRRRFFTWSLVGAVLWASMVTVLGYVLGGVEFLQRNIEVVLLVLVALSLVPPLVEWARHRRNVEPGVGD